MKLVGITNVAPGQTPVVEVTYADDFDQPLDYLGKATPGPLSISFILAWYDAEGRHYTAYTTRTRNGRTVPSADQNGTNGWTHLEMGHSRYTFLTKLPADMDVTKTHTLGVYGRRTLNTIIGKNYYADNINYNFRPDGNPVAATWAAMDVKACNNCHDPLGLHGGTRRTTNLCVLCHQPQIPVDATSKESFDMKVFIHKIHRGKDLPSVVAGTKYMLAGGDYSTIAFPQDIRNCTTCHEKDAAEGSIWYTRPNRVACGSCHDNVNWETGENHSAGPQTDDTACASCHQPEGDHEFDVSIQGAHTIPTKSAQLPGLKMEILAVTGATPGSKPTVTFKVTDNAGAFVDPATLSSCNFLLGGTTAGDYSRYFREACNKNVTVQGDSAALTFVTNAIPADATGTWTLSADYYKSVKINLGTAKEQTVRNAGMNPIFKIAIGDVQPMARRVVVKLDSCNKCHETLALHGGQRYKVEECVICHNANETDVSVRPTAEAPSESIHFKYMIHKIHTGEDLARDFTIYGHGGSLNNYNEVRYPGDRRNCQACHLAKTYNVPTPEGALPTQSARDWYTPMLPDAAACLSCHGSKEAAAHAWVNTAPFGESCAACHGVNGEFSVDRVHAR